MTLSGAQAGMANCDLVPASRGRVDQLSLSGQCVEELLIREHVGCQK